MVTHFECSRFLHVNLEIVLEICKQSLLKYRQSRATLNQSRVVFQSLKDFSCLLPHTLVLIWCRQKRPHLCRNVAFFLPNLDNIADWMLEKARNNFLTQTRKTTKWLLIIGVSSYFCFSGLKSGHNVTIISMKFEKQKDLGQKIFFFNGNIFFYFFRGHG